MSFKEKYDAFEKEFIELWGEYVKVSDELDLYRGKHLDENVDEVNRILGDIQKTFAKIYPALMFIVKRNHDCEKLLSAYDKFIDDIKKAGAQEVNDEVH